MMHPDFPHQGGSGPDPVEQLLRTLPTAALPSDWRPGILAAAVPPPTLPFFTRSLTSFLAFAWGLIAVLHFTTPAPSPAPSTSFPALPYPREMPSNADFTDPWLAQLQNPSFPSEP